MKTISRENLTLMYVNNKDADQPVYLHGLISTFVICFLVNIMNPLARHKHSILF